MKLELYAVRSVFPANTMIRAHHGRRKYGDYVNLRRISLMNLPIISVTLEIQEVKAVIHADRNLENVMSANAGHILFCHSHDSGNPGTWPPIKPLITLTKVCDCYDEEADVAIPICEPLTEN